MIHITKIYLVTNCYNDPNKVYIGKTKTSRKSAHKCKFGNQITYDYIDEVPSLNKNDWKPLETYWIHQFRQWGFEVVNKNEGGGGPEIHSEETKQKMRFPKSEEHKLIVSKSILQYDLKGNFIKEWTSIAKAKSEGFGGVDMCVLGVTKTAGNYIWRYKTSPLPKEYNIPKHKSCISLLQYSLSGNFINEWDSIRDACNILNMDPGTITSVCKGRQKTAYGFIWKYKN